MASTDRSSRATPRWRAGGATPTAAGASSSSRRTKVGRLAEIKKRRGRPAGCRRCAGTQRPLGSAAPPRGTEGSEPKEYTAFWGRMAQWLQLLVTAGRRRCRPPRVASRIVAVGAATADGAGLRAAMKRKELGPAMEFILDDPALDDAALDAVRRYLVDVRDGGMPNQLVFDAPGATRELPLAQRTLVARHAGDDRAAARFRTVRH